jgi:hypothetical protein
MKVHKNEVLEHLFKIYRGILLASQDWDYEFIEEYTEETFGTKLVKRLKEVDGEGMELWLWEDLYADNGKPMQIEVNMYDHTVIKGLFPNRKSNGSVDDYTINNDIDSMGFISYIPKYI